ncbi:MAG: hypothetical protein JW776_09305 [Candidatus Lokiarchaeota archaeon]|nr:hypothetical protein [Candidatus Lokiarchaeota archaeon]
MDSKLKTFGLIVVFSFFNVVLTLLIVLAIFRLESPNRALMGVLFIPWIFILTFFWINRFIVPQKWKTKLQLSLDLWFIASPINREPRPSPLPVTITFMRKQYSFSLVSLIFFPIWATILILLLFHYQNTHEVVWWQELFARHDVFLINLFSDVDSFTYYSSAIWLVENTNGDAVYVTNGCVGLPAMAIFSALLLVVPRPRSHSNREDLIKRADFLWRKVNAITVAVGLIYFFNITRAAIQFILHSRGHLWSVVHDSNEMLAIMVSIHILIFLICVALLPEIFLSIFYIGKCLVGIGQKRKIPPTKNTS